MNSRVKTQPYEITENHRRAGPHRFLALESQRSTHPKAFRSLSYSSDPGVRIDV